MSIGILYMLGVVALWSFVPTLVKLLLPVFDPMTITFLRTAQGLAVTLALLYVGGGRLRAITWSRWHLVGGLGMSLNYSLYAVSLSYTTASAGVLIVQVQYVTLAALAAFVLHERLGWGKIASMGVVLTGIAVVVGFRAEVGHLFAPRYMLGNVLMLGSGIGWGVYALSNKALAPRASTAAILVPMMAVCAVVTGTVAAVQFQLHAAPTSATLLAVLIVGALGTGLSFILVSEGIKRLSAALAGTITAATPIAQIAMAHHVLDEPLSWSVIGGGIIILGGILAMVLTEQAQVRRARISAA